MTGGRMRRMGNVSQRDGKITKSHLCGYTRQLDAPDERKERVRARARGRNGKSVIYRDRYIVQFIITVQSRMEGRDNTKINRSPFCILSQDK